MSDKSSDISLTGKEIAVLSVASSTSDTGICAADVTSTLAREIGKEPRLSTIYNIIIGLERKGLIKPIGYSSGENGGRPRRLFSITETGELALSLAERMYKGKVLEHT
ncbi:MAG TPA: hypothetical protein VGC35_10430 [Allosphingosinicella sp.]|jgi:DNA-binding PadR family transcriptional regulator